MLTPMAMRLVIFAYVCFLFSVALGDGGDVDVHGDAACDIRLISFFFLFSFAFGGGGGGGGWERGWGVDVDVYGNDFLHVIGRLHRFCDCLLTLSCPHCVMLSRLSCAQ